MTYIYFGAFCFLLLILYDLNQVRGNHRFFKPFFAIGFVGLLISSIGLCLGKFPGDWSFFIPRILCGVCLFVTSSFLLVYTLFFAIPFDEAYIDGSKQKICTVGIYAICRHPGVIFFLGCYIGLGLMVSKPFVIFVGIVYSLFNLFYAFLQDRYFFLILFDGYEEYKKTTPFLIPNKKSMKACLDYFTYRF